MSADSGRRKQNKEVRQMSEDSRRRKQSEEVRQVSEDRRTPSEEARCVSAPVPVPSLTTCKDVLVGRQF